MLLYSPVMQANLTSQLRLPTCVEKRAKCCQNPNFIPSDLFRYSIGIAISHDLFRHRRDNREHYMETGYRRIPDLREQ